MKNEIVVLKVPSFPIPYLMPSTNEESLYNNITDINLFEGDIELDSTDDFGNDNSSVRDFVTEKDYKLTNKSGAFLMLPFTLPNGLTKQEKVQIKRATWEFRSKTCVK